jgi:hypothetical protein
MRRLGHLLRGHPKATSLAVAASIGALTGLEWAMAAVVGGTAAMLVVRHSSTEPVRALRRRLERLRRAMRAPQPSPA